jgi:signal peptidase I
MFFKLFKKVDFILIVIMICFCFFAIFVVNKTVVEGNSMENTYKNQDVLITSLVYTSLDRNDVVVFFSDNQGSGSIVPNMFSTLWETRYQGNKTRDIYIKRIIALPGETIEMRDKKVYVNSKPIDENYTKLDWFCNGEPSNLATDYTQILVPKDSYFVMGDNRGCSSDSRVLGVIKKQAILGKVFDKIKL